MGLDLAFQTAPAWVEKRTIAGAIFRKPWNGEACATGQA
jgi:hypothetical protein